MSEVIITDTFVKENCRPGSVFFVGHGGPIASLIAWFQKGCKTALFPLSYKFVHVGILLENGKTIESNWKGVHKGDIRKYAKTQHLAIFHPYNTITLNQLEKFYQKYTSRPYGFLSILGFFLVRFLGKDVNPFTDGQICTENVHKFCLEEVRDQLIQHHDQNTWYPAELFTYLENTSAGYNFYYCKHQ